MSNEDYTWCLYVLVDCVYMQYLAFKSLRLIKIIKWKSARVTQEKPLNVLFNEKNNALRMIRRKQQNNGVRLVDSSLEWNTSGRAKLPSMFLFWRATETA